MVMGVGTDILLIDRIRRSCLDLTDPFIRKTYTQREQEQAAERSDPALYFATRFAGKEAVFKTLGIDGDKGAFNQIEILNDFTGRPVVALHGEISELARNRNIAEVLLSISYDAEYATAFAVAQSI